VSGITEGRQHEPATAAVAPQESEKLKELVEAILSAMNAGEKEKVSAYFEALAIPNHQEWFEKTFGGKEGKRLEEQYARLLRQPIDDQQAYFFAAVKAEKTNAAVIVLEKAESAKGQLDRAILGAMLQPTPLYVTVATGASGGSSWHLGRFVFVEGAFRYIDDRVFEQLTGAPVMRIRMGGNVMAAQLVNRVQPVYPEEALAKRLAGTVRLHIITGADGAVKIVELMSGDPILAKAAMEAVRQWRYRPTLLNGKPVEVDSTVDVVFRAEK